MKTIKITQKKSKIKKILKHKSTLIGLGLKYIGHTVERKYTPEIIGMIRSISYMIKIEK
ncbi:50S ribosomal protein L30 [Sodalis-like secondary symbiont of Drepanosiphum platanoidis]|uniref:50S ribosomal protein L30 n=1 Tax=Sodalis-like secondary symbiont of Drepanosiphum platanoidis TaxID=2994493 RepID=UPI0034639D89